MLQKTRCWPVNIFKDMELKQYQAGDEGAILELFQKAFGKPLSPEYWNWRFGNNPFLPDPMIHLMWEGETMAGHYGVSAIEMCIDGQVYLASLSGTTMTHPEFEGKGIFSSLASTLYERVAAEHGIHGVLGFPNKNSHYGLVKKIHWKDVSIVPSFSIQGAKLENREVEGLELIGRFEGEHITFIREMIDALGFSVFVNRSETYMNWRYINCPVNEYQCFEYRAAGKLAGIIITKSFTSFDKPGAFEVDILEVFCAPELDVIREMLTGVKQFYAAQGTDFVQMNAWISLFDARHLVMERLGFSIGMPLTFMCSKVFIPGTEQVYDFRNWYISMGDSDVY